MNNPFDWKNYKPQISLKDIETSRRISYQAMKQVNKKRMEGIEPSSPASLRTAQHITADPASLALDLPTMTTYRKRRNKK